MEPRVKNNEIVFGEIAKLNEKEYFYKVAHLLAAWYIPTEAHLTDRELEYFYCAYKCIRGGSRDLLDIHNISKYFKSFKDKNTAKLWLKRIIDKKWIDEHNSKYYLMGDFERLGDLDIAKFRLDILKGEDNDKVGG